MTDETGFGFIITMTKLTKHALAERSKLNHDLPPLHPKRSLQIFYRILESYRALNLHENSPIAGLTFPERGNMFTLPSMELDLVIYEHLCNMILAAVQSDVRYLQPFR